MQVQYVPKRTFRNYKPPLINGTSLRAAYNSRNNFTRRAILWGRRDIRQYKSSWRIFANRLIYDRFEGPIAAKKKESCIRKNLKNSHTETKHLRYVTHTAVGKRCAERAVFLVFEIASGILAFDAVVNIAESHVSRSWEVPRSSFDRKLRRLPCTVTGRKRFTIKTPLREERSWITHRPR